MMEHGQGPQTWSVRVSSRNNLSCTDNVACIAILKCAVIDCLVYHLGFYIC